MKVLVTGAEGMLGCRVCKALSGRHKVIPTDLLSKDYPLDICDSSAVMDFVGRVSPDVIVHCAALTDVDGCTRDPDVAYKVNAIGTINIACAAAQLDIPVVYISTDYVFDGTKRDGYTEFDSPNPVNIYGKSKLAGELSVKELLKKFYIVRTSWLFAATHKNFPLSILNAAVSGRELKVVNDQFGSPTYADDLAAFIAQLIETAVYGTYHFTNAGSCSWYEFAVKLLELANMSNVTISPIESAQWETPTDRPKYSVLRHYRLKLMGKDFSRTWEEAAEEFIREWTTAKP